MLASLSPSNRLGRLMAGTLVSRTGEWMDLVTLNWVALQMTNSPLHLGLINACRLVPTFLMSLPAGILADRYDRGHLLLLTQALSAALTLLLAFAAAASTSFWLFAAVVTLRAMASAMDAPIRSALVPQLVGPDQVSRAVALQSTLLSMSRILGPALGGILMGVLGAPAVFAISAGLIALALPLTAGLRSDAPRRPASRATLSEALDYLKGEPLLQALMLLAIVPMIFGFPYTAMMPLFVRDVIGLGPQGLGILLSVTAIGALLGSGRLSVMGEGPHVGRWLILSLLAFGGSLMLLMQTRSLPAAALVMGLVGLTGQTYRTLSRISLQTRVPDHLRGRVMSIALMDRGFIPLGALFIGLVAGWAGAWAAGMAMGVGCIGITVLVLMRSRSLLRL
ncbi:enterobactin exporter EntS [compost metagenome]